MTVITSTSNARIKHLRALRNAKGRRSAGLTLAEGPVIAREAVESGASVALLVAADGDGLGPELARQAGCELLIVTPPVLASIATTKEPQGPIAVVAPSPPRPLRVHDVIVLHDISDPGNVGTIVRSARAFGWDVALSGATADPWSPKAVRASAGTVFDSHLARIGDPVDEPRRGGLLTVGLTVVGGVEPTRTPSTPIALIVGSEAHGLPSRVLEAVDRLFTIATDDRVESLNAAVAASVAMYALHG
jgi:TrmH family RNA methyltransferase